MTMKVNIVIPIVNPSSTWIVGENVIDCPLIRDAPLLQGGAPVAHLSFNRAVTLDITAKVCSVTSECLGDYNSESLSKEMLGTTCLCEPLVGRY